MHSNTKKVENTTDYREGPPYGGPPNQLSFKNIKKKETDGGFSIERGNPTNDEVWLYKPNI